MSEEWISKQIYKTEWRAVLKLFNIIFDKCMEERSETYQNDQKHTSIGVLRKMCSENVQQIYRRTPMLKSDFKKVAKQLN